MEVTIAYFWALKALLGLAAGFSAYIWIYVHKFQSKLYGIIFGILLILGVISPVKLATINYTTTSNKAIEMSKTLPNKVEDNSFKERVDSVQPISHDTIWSK